MNPATKKNKPRDHAQMRIIPRNRSAPDPAPFFEAISRSRSAQVGETVTWIVATIIIILTLVVFIFISSKIADLKNLGPNLNSKFLKGDTITFNWLEAKTSFAHKLAQDKNKIIIDEWIKENEK